MNKLKVLLVSLTFLTTAQAQTTKTTISTPAPGSPVRRAILNAVRVPVMRHFDQKLISFKVTDLRVSGSWAFLRARPLNAANEALRDPQSGAPEVWALLQKSAVQKSSGQKSTAGWQVRRWAMPTDLISLGWAQEFPNVPAKLWPQNRY